VIAATRDQYACDTGWQPGGSAYAPRETAATTVTRREKMGKAALVILMAAATVRAEPQPCDDVCRPVEKLDPQVRDELITGAVVVAAGHLMGTLALLRANGVGHEYALAPLPIIGALDGAASDGVPSHVRMVLVFSVAIQMVGALFSITAWATRDVDRERRLSFTGDGMQLHF
jgi:hypothetical protein